MLPQTDALQGDPAAEEEAEEEDAESVEQDDEMGVAADAESEDEPAGKKTPLIPLPPASFLAPGQTFSGSQTVNQYQAKPADEWRVNVHIQAVDWQRGRISGSMEALDVPKAAAPVVTFWEGEIVDNRNYFFWTGRWEAHVEQDVDHWKRFVGFSRLHARVKKDRGDDIDLATCRYIFMRWKEVFFVSPGEDCGLTIAGFYYICMDRFTGSMLGYYYDPKSQPYQELRLNAVSLPGGHVFSSYDFN
ncbi:unnamed protein product [Chondrus crispus]|uniref:Uncharacterized protein n=1 Tax=Chondrus crispus TaxID=2769 RepID=R7QNR0_CHOCR|nr:unnamed protein product [Chondrus crispus]CDF39744.1 unnamed protein product [Chondrus crispus]|eukprot:XP_005710038.1 unnamed protein product [Chondrus crispus]